MAIFDADRPMRVAAFFSGGASGIRYLLNHDPGCGEDYEIVVGFTDDPECTGRRKLKDNEIPVITRDIRSYYDERGAATEDMDVRSSFDAGTADRIAEYAPDCVLLSGYMWILTEPIVSQWPVVNVHPGDLCVTDDEGNRVYIGMDPVYDAIKAGENVTRSSVHLVTSAVDEGPVLVRSKPHSVHRKLVETLIEYDADEQLRNYADAHQEWMKWTGDGPALATAIELLATGRVKRENGSTLIDGEPRPFDLENES